MNERIKELARQAYVKDSLEHDPDWKQTEVYNCLMNELDGFFEKFAELIVRECLNAVVEQKKWVENQEVFSLQDEQWNQARIQQSEHIVDKIKQHFGVEE